LKADHITNKSSLGIKVEDITKSSVPRTHSDVSDK